MLILFKNVYTQTVLLELSIGKEKLRIRINQKRGEMHPDMYSDYL